MKVEVFSRCLAGLLATGFVATLAAQSEDPATRPARPPVVEKVLSGPTVMTRDSSPRVVFEIARGDEGWGKIVIELNRKKAPFTVESFLHYVDEGYYDGTIYHRVIPHFMIQGGGYVSLTEEKKTKLRRPVRNEAKNGLKNLRGTIAMARQRSPHSATTQFFINVADNPALDYPSRDGWGYCVFGEVIEGMAVVDRIKDVKTRHNPDASVDASPSQPIDPPLIKKAYGLGGEAIRRPARMKPHVSPVQEQPEQMGGDDAEEAPEDSRQIPPEHEREEEKQRQAE